MDYSKEANKRRRRKDRPQTTRIRNKVSLMLLRVVLAVVLIGGFAAVGAGFGLWMGILANAPEINLDFITNVNQSSQILDARTGEVREVLHAGHNREFVSIDQIPKHVQNAFVAIEDERFWTHNGIDIRSIGRAIHTVISTGGERTEGASTITQQLIKNMLGRFDSDLITKLQEQYLAVNFENYLEQQLGSREAAKEFILESYLNIINLGRSNYGVQAAAQFYFGVDVGELTIAQAATIAAITQNPWRFPPDTRPADNWGRAQLVLQNMLRNGFITEEEYSYARRQRPGYNPRTGAALYDDEGNRIYLGYVYDTIVRVDGEIRTIISPFDCFTDALIAQVRLDLMREFGIDREQANRIIFTQGTQIFSTQNLEYQAIVDQYFLDPAVWPQTGLTIDVVYEMTVFNDITRLRRHYQRFYIARDMDDAEAWIQSIQSELLTANDSIENESRMFTPQPQAAFILTDHHTGHVLAMRGVRGEKGANATFNRVTQSTRSPGSQMKPLVPFAPGIEIGLFQPATIIEDMPFTLIGTAGAANWSPQNWWNTGYEGPMTVRRAIYRSANVVSARAGADPRIPHVGVPMMRAFLENLGITTLGPHDGAAMVLGGLTHGLRLIELNQAYAAIANGGQMNPNVLYTMVLDHQGNVLLENAHNPRTVMSPSTAYLLIDMMKDTMTAAGATGHNANWTVGSGLRGRIPISGKTGTSQRNTDLGFTASTPFYTASIWMGNDSAVGMPGINNQIHTPVWRMIMEDIHRDFPSRDFDRPATIVHGRVCALTGKLAGEFCSATRVDLFATGHGPTDICTGHRTVYYCTVSGLMSRGYCPSTTLVSSGLSGYCDIHFPQPNIPTFDHNQGEGTNQDVGQGQETPAETPPVTVSPFDPPPPPQTPAPGTIYTATPPPPGQGYEPPPANTPPPQN